MEERNSYEEGQIFHLQVLDFSIMILCHQIIEEAFEFLLDFQGAERQLESESKPGGKYSLVPSNKTFLIKALNRNYTKTNTKIYSENIK